MILGYTVPHEKENILKGLKIHTMRMDRVNRWHEGRLIHHSTGTRSKDYECFLVNKCKGTQKVLLLLLEEKGKHFLKVTVDRKRLSQSEVELLAINDGFETLQDMIDFFFKDKDITMAGLKIIHWTNLKY